MTRKVAIFAALLGLAGSAAAQNGKRCPLGSGSLSQGDGGRQSQDAAIFG